MTIFIVLFVIIQFTAISIFEAVNVTYIAGITAFITAIIAPRMKVVATQSRDKIQIKWLFSKKTRLI